MAAPRTDDAVLLAALKAYEDAGGVMAEAARRSGENLETFKSRVREARKRFGIKRLAHGRVEAIGAKKASLPAKGQVKRYVLTSAQNNTHVWQGFENVRALAEHYGAEIFVGTYSYNKSAYGEASTKRGKGPTVKDQGNWYDPAVEPYIVDGRVQLAPGLVWCGEMNILPTAKDPLSGLETYAGRQSCVVPHAKIEMRSVASGKNEGTKLNFTTGTITQRNYISKRAGLEADFLHAYGAVVVEVCADGTWFVRQLHAGDDDSIYDLDLKVQAGMVTNYVAEGGQAEAISWGDIHAELLEDEQFQVAWGEAGIFETLRPRHQFMHDVLDMRFRNHHESKDPHKMFAKHIRGKESGRAEVGRARRFLIDTKRDWCQTVVVSSNHDMALERWLREADYRYDPVNAIFFLELQLAKYKAIEAGDKGFYLFEYACRELYTEGAGTLIGVKFLKEDESFVICRDGLGGIECGMHGDKGPNGAKGTPQNLRKLGRPATIGDKHTAGIYGKLYVAGVTGPLDMGYNRGPSSWTHSHVLTYPNGRRAIVTVFNGKWRA